MNDENINTQKELKLEAYVIENQLGSNSSDQNEGFQQNPNMMVEVPLSERLDTKTTSKSNHFVEDTFSLTEKDILTTKGKILQYGMFKVSVNMQQFSMYYLLGFFISFTQDEFLKETVFQKPVIIVVPVIFQTLLFSFIVLALVHLHEGIVKPLESFNRQFMDIKMIPISWNNGFRRGIRRTYITISVTLFFISSLGIFVFLFISTILQGDLYVFMRITHMLFFISTLLLIVYRMFLTIFAASKGPGFLLTEKYKSLNQLLTVCTAVKFKKGTSLQTMIIWLYLTINIIYQLCVEPIKLYYKLKTRQYFPVLGNYYTQIFGPYYGYLIMYVLYLIVYYGVCTTLFFWTLWNLIHLAMQPMRKMAAAEGLKKYMKIN